MVRREAWRSTDLRRNIRHVSSFPVECRREGNGGVAHNRLKDIGHGGLGLVSEKPLATGDVFDFVFPGLDYTQSVRGQVVWVQPASDEAQGAYVGGVRFIEESPYTHARLVVDLCHVEYYRRDQRQRHGRQLDYAQALREWKERASRATVH